jgi:hypothetical protein
MDKILTNGNKAITSKLKLGSAVFEDNSIATIIDCGSNLTSDITNFTTEAWLYFTGGPDTFNVYAGRGVSSTYNYWHTQIRTDSTGKGHARLSIGNNDNGAQNYLVFNTTSTLLPNKWYHVAFVKSGTSVSSYVDGVLNTTATWPYVTNPSTPLYIGNNIREYSPAKFKGRLSDFRIWNYARTATQIAENYKRVLKPQSGLVAYYKLNGNALDSSGFGNHGTETNVGYSVDGVVPVSSVAKFITPHTDYISTSVASVSGGLTAITYEGWVYKQTDSLGSGKHGVFFSNANTGNYLSASKTQGICSAHILKSDGTGTIVQRLVYTSGETIPDNTWYHQAMTYDGTTLKLYVNGVFRGSITEVGTIKANTSPLEIGRFGSSDSTYAFKGQLGVLRAWSKALTQKEILDNMYKVLPASTTGLLEQWTLNGNALGTNGNNGTITGGVTFVPDSPKGEADVSSAVDKSALVVSKSRTVGQRSGLKFNGTTNEIHTPFLANRNMATQPITVHAWVKITGAYSSIFSTGGFTTNQRFYVGIPINGTCWDIGVQASPWDTTDVPAARAKFNAWTNIAVVATGTEVILYVNGVEVKRKPYTSYTLSNNLTIGNIVGASNDAFFKGVISAFTIVDKALTSTEIKANMHRYLPADTPNLIEQWKLNEGVGSTVYGTKGNNGTITGTATWTTPSLMNWKNKVARFVGGSDYITTTNSSSLNPVSAITLEVWVKPTTSSSEFNTIIRKDSQYIIRLNNAQSQIHIGHWSNNLSFLLLHTHGKPINTWFHIAYTYSVSTGMQKLYVDGVEVLQAARTGNIDVTTNNMFTGWFSGGQMFNGSIDEVRVWNTVRTATEIQDNYQRSLDRHPNLVLNMNFDSSLTHDSSGFGNHGTIVGNVTQEDSDNDKLLFNAPIND